MSELSQAVLLPNGSHYQTTGGRWIYVLDESGTRARRRDIQIGRQNSEYYEILEGLEPGERVIISSYESFGEAEQLIIQ
jgi:HlyD family secretion protein